MAAAVGPHPMLRSNLGCPGAVTERLGPLASIRTCLRSLDRRSWAPILRAFTFEDHQCRPRARHRVAGDLTEFRPAEFDRRESWAMATSFCTGQRLNETPLAVLEWDSMLRGRWMQLVTRLSVA